MERRVLFKDGIEVDFAIYSIETINQFTQNKLPREGAITIRRGIKVLIDKDGLISKICLSVVETPEFLLPTEYEFLNLVNDFLYHFVWVMKKLGRGELWTAKSCVDSYMKRRLLTMIEWYAHAVNGVNYDTWHNGRFIEEWAEPRIVQKLSQTASFYNKQDIKRCLGETLELFSMLSIETAQHWGYPYPLENEKQIVKWVNENLSQAIAFPQPSN